jgi:hypothetical protein
MILPSGSISPTSARLGVLLAALSLVGFALACNLQSPPAVSGDVLFQDDFSRTMSGWDRYKDDLYSADYTQGGYRIQVFAPQTDAWANPGLNLADVRIEFDASKQSGPDNNSFGALCRYQNTHDFYFFLISSDGYAGIGISLNGRRVLLSGDTMYPSGAVLLGDATNHIRADCIGSQLALYVNGILVSQAQSSQWANGDVGLTAGSFDEPGVDILFSNFTVIQP